MAVGYCPECDAEIHFRNDHEEGQTLNCSTCNAYLIVIGLRPIELDWVNTEEQFAYGEEEFES